MYMSVVAFGPQLEMGFRASAILVLISSWLSSTPSLDGSALLMSQGCDLAMTVPWLASADNYPLWLVFAPTIRHGSRALHR
jgi:hypothetical protein